MSFFSRLFGSVASAVIRPLKIQDPTIGFLNLCGDSATRLLESDKQALGPLFRKVRVSESLPPPQCDVLFIYCRLSPEADASDAIYSPRDLIKSARAYVAVFAMENDPNAYIRRIGKRTDWPANIVMVLNRNGDKFAAFFQQLFTAMFDGLPMPMAWVQLAPQGRSPKHADNPSSIYVAEAGNVMFTRTSNHRWSGDDVK
jgi:hypothetical protein